MDIRSCYEAGAVLFWLLFAYLFMDKFLFRGGLGAVSYTHLTLPTICSV